MRITIDFDDTLTKPHIQELAKKLVKRHEVYILTSRLDSLYSKAHRHLHSNDDIYDVAEKVGIVIGMCVYGIIDQVTGSPRFAIVFLALFFFIAVLLLKRVPSKKAS